MHRSAGLTRARASQVVAPLDDQPTVGMVARVAGSRQTYSRKYADRRATAIDEVFAPGRG
jgi:hypothetical protein